MVAAIGFGLVEAAVISIAAIGFTIQFAMTNVLNLAYGAMIAVSIYAGYYSEVGLGANQWLSVGAGIVCGAAASYLLYVILLRPFARRGARLLTMVVVTVSGATVITYSLQLAVGPQQVTYGVDSGTLYRAAGFELTTTQLGIIGLAVLVALLTICTFRFTTFGKAMRATAANPTIAAASGVPILRVRAFAWIISGGICGAGAVALAMSVGTVSFTTGTAFLIEVVAAAILGGVGNVQGAIVGAGIIGVVSEVAATYTSPSYKDVFAFAILLLVLLVRPAGLLGTLQEREALTQ